VQIMTSCEQLGNGEDVGLETFKQGAVLTEEEQPHASPPEQWAALAAALDAGGGVSGVAQVMREICDAVGHEVQKEARAPPAPRWCMHTCSEPGLAACNRTNCIDQIAQSSCFCLCAFGSQCCICWPKIFAAMCGGGMQEALDSAEAQAQGGVMVTKKVKLPPGPYCKMAVERPQLELLRRVLALEPAAVQTAASRAPTRGVGSHRHALPLHASFRGRAVGTTAGGQSSLL
jgi:hypothetical protein